MATPVGAFADPGNREALKPPLPFSRHITPHRIEDIPLTNHFFEQKTDQESRPTTIPFTLTLILVPAQTIAPKLAGQLEDATREKLIELVKTFATK